MMSGCKILVGGVAVQSGDCTAVITKHWLSTCPPLLFGVFVPLPCRMLPSCVPASSLRTQAPWPTPSGECVHSRSWHLFDLTDWGDISVSVCTQLSVSHGMLAPLGSTGALIRSMPPRDHWCKLPSSYPGLTQ
jgi:hypothetical protein